MVLVYWNIKQLQNYVKPHANDSHISPTTDNNRQILILSTDFGTSISLSQSMIKVIKVQQSVGNSGKVVLSVVFIWNWSVAQSGRTSTSFVAGVV